MISEEEIVRAARVVMKAHGKRATLVAENRAAACLRIGDAGTKAIWLRIAEAIREQQAKKRQP